jgi:broad specificity phosphatase PhoE
MTQILLVRHGQTEWNRIERFRGRIDIPLNETGRHQAQVTGRWIAARWNVSHIYTSPLSRAFQTAEAIAQCYGLTVEVYPELVDLNFGAWQGKTPEEVRAIWPEIYTAWVDNPQGVRIPDGETIDELRARSFQAVQELVDCHPGETIVLVGHTDVNRAIIMGILQLQTRQIWQLRQDNCAINLIQASGDRYVLVSMNEIGHLIYFSRQEK